MKKAYLICAAALIGACCLGAALAQADSSNFESSETWAKIRATDDSHKDAKELKDLKDKDQWKKKTSPKPSGSVILTQ